MKRKEEKKKASLMKRRTRAIIIGVAKTSKSPLPTVAAVFSFVTVI